jgi:hypothetical protein
VGGAARGGGRRRPSRRPWRRRCRSWRPCSSGRWAWPRRPRPEPAGARRGAVRATGAARRSTRPGPPRGRTRGRSDQPSRPWSDRSASRRTASGRATAGSTSPGPRARRCWRRPPGSSCSPACWPAAGCCPCSTPTGCGRPTNPSWRPSWAARPSPAGPSSARSPPGTRAARPPACTGGRAATGRPTSTRSCCSRRRTSACCRCPTRGRTAPPRPSGSPPDRCRGGGAAPVPRRAPQPVVSSSSAPRSRPTRRECSWQILDSVTPSIRPISASVRRSR